MSQEKEVVTSCVDKELLSEREILTTLHTLMHNLILKSGKRDFIDVECKMTKPVKENLISANKKLKMYGKTPCIIPCFDSNFRELPDSIVTTGENRIRIVEQEDDKMYIIMTASYIEPDIHIHHEEEEDDDDDEEEYIW